jgi:hypothetical protein
MVTDPQVRLIPDAPNSLVLTCQCPLLAGLALAGFEITHAEALRPFVLIGALVIIGAAALWLLDEFVWPLWRH